MTRQQNLAEQLFEAALNLDPEKREAFLDEHCGGDPELKSEVKALLLDDERAGSFLLDSPFEFVEAGSTGSPLAFETRAFPPGFEFPRPSAPGNRLSPGQTLAGRFTIVRFIAKGGMGEVYEAEDRLLEGVHVALKTIRPHIANDPDLQQQFKREALIAREVTHPNLCPIYDVFYCEEPTPGALFLSMKLLSGGTLAARLREPSPIPHTEALAILKQMAAGISAIHKAGIVHRDIKTSNVMLDGQGRDLRLRITDFGLARPGEFEVVSLAPEKLAGTPAYMAPELFQNKAPSQGSDLYAFGVVMHEVFTGEKPSVNSSDSSVVVNPRLLTSGLPAYAVQVVRGCLDSSPKHRCQAFDALLETLEPSERKPALWTRRRFIGTAVAGGCFMAGGAAWQWDRLDNLFHPLPRKRFVALLNWPRTNDNSAAPMVNGAMNAIKAALTRVEASDHNLFVVSPEDVNRNIKDGAHLAEICDPLGANLVLALSCSENAKELQLMLRLLNPVTSESLRSKIVSCPRSEMTSLPERATLAAASLLNLNSFLRKNDRPDPGTQSAAAFAAFQSAETLLKQPNEAGLDAAIEKYKEALDSDPSYAIAHAQLASAYVTYFDFHQDTAALDLARRNADLALSLDHNLEEGHLALAQILRETGDEQGVLNELGKVLAVNSSSLKAIFFQAVTYARLNRWSDAEKSFKQILKLRPNSWINYTELAYLLHQQGKFQEAVEQFRFAGLTAPRSSLALGNLGTAYLQVGKFAEGFEYLKKSLALDPDYDFPIVNSSLALRYQGKYLEALPYARKATTLTPTDDTNWLELGDCYSSLPHRGQEAREAYQRAAEETKRHLAIDNTDGAAWLRLAFYQVKTHEGRDFTTLIEKAESLGAADVDSQLCKARILELQGHRAEALAIVADWFRRGASDFQIIPLPDMSTFRTDPRYQAIVKSNLKEPPGDRVS
jgi:eukaryotic-like serine/threonine-protein kinase